MKISHRNYYNQFTNAHLTLKFILTVFMLAGLMPAMSQPKHYTVSNAHSHNDYENPVPFWAAYNAGFGSIEADIFLQDGKLIVAHDLNEVKNQRSLEKFYLDPLLSCLEKNHQHIYPDAIRQLQLMIDVKTEAVSTLKRLIEVLQGYPSLIHCASLHFVISGSRPSPDSFSVYPSFILFDGDLSKSYGPEAQKKIAMMSDNFIRYAIWNGKDTIPAAGLEKLKDAIAKAHAIQKPVRLWASPDSPNAWDQLMKLGVDFINTDKITELAEYLK